MVKMRHLSKLAILIWCRRFDLDMRKKQGGKGRVENNALEIILKDFKTNFNG